MSNSEMPGRKKLLAWQVPLVITCLSLLAISLLIIVFSIKVYMIVFTLALSNGFSHCFKRHFLAYSNPGSMEGGPRACWDLSTSEP